MNNSKVKQRLRISYKVLWNLFLIFFVLILVGFSFAGGVGAGYFASLVKDEPIRSYDSMRKDIYNYEETTELYFADNVYLGKLRSDLDRNEVELENVSEYVKKALIATEDEFFYEHSGIVPKAIVRAVFQEFTNSQTKSGGSTLTQQLIKNQILTNEVSFERKAKEIMLALRLERGFKKEEILEAYLNVVPFGRNSSGRNIAGIQTAAQGVFGIDAKDLNLPQAAYLAGLPQSPFGYTPFTQKGEVKEDIEPGINRMKIVLQRMFSTGAITEVEYKEALNYDIGSNLAPPKVSPVQKYPWLAFELERRAIEVMTYQLAEKDGLSKEDLDQDDKLYNEYHIKADRDLRRKGYKIYSTIDKQIYDKMQEIKNNYEYYGSEKAETIIDPNTGEETRVLEPVETAAVLIENKTGRIISFIGGRDHEREQLNHATLALRSNGSTMKPLLVYAPAIELGLLHPGSPVPDVPSEFKAGTTTWSPGNYSNNYHGMLTARYALAKSYNIPAARTYAKTINQNPVQYLEKMGFTSLTEGDHYHLSMALGGLDRGVTVEENVNAYATFGNYGKFIDSYMIEKIVSNDGEIIYEHRIEPVEVFSPQTSYLTVDMMQDVLSYGTAAGLKHRLNFNADWAGKTGTSQNYHDAWFVATNPSITFGTWIGYDTPKRLEKSYKGLSYSNRNQKLWAELMNAVYELKPELINKDEQFKMPGGIVRRSYCGISGLLPSELCSEAGLVKTDLFNAKHVPKEKDNSLTKAKFYTVNGKKYLANENVPTEFTQEGIMLSPDYLKEEQLDKLENLNTLIPDNSWKNIVVVETEEVENNNVPPTKVQDIKLENNKITWARHSHQDIIGYRVYKSPDPYSPPTEVKTVPTTGEPDPTLPISYQVDNVNAVYRISAVDIYGNEGPISEIITGAIWDDTKPYIPDPFEDPNDKDQNEGSSDEGTPRNNEEDLPNQNDNNEDKPTQPSDPNSPDDEKPTLPDPLDELNF